MPINKKCEICNTELISIHPLTKYCDVCREIKNLQHKKQCQDRKKQENSKTMNEEFTNNFIYIANKGIEFLTNKGFNNVSKISVKSYTHFYKSNWAGILKLYNKNIEMVNYICLEFGNYNKLYSNKSIETFCKQHKYITYELIKQLGTNEILSKCNIKQIYEISDFENNFNIVKQKLNRTPLYREFEGNSNISIETYARKLKLKKPYYDSIVKLYCTNKEYNDYLINKKQHKTNVGKITSSNVNIISLDTLKNEFKKVFDDCFNNFNTYPSRRLFNKLSKHDDSVYRKRLNMKWTDICKLYGYEIDGNNKSEKYVLECISKLLSSKYESQKTWEWLIGVGGKHLYCDGYFKELDLVIEFDGKQHRTPIKHFGGFEKFLINQQNDKLKDKLLKENSIDIIRIDSREKWYDLNYLAKKLHKHGYTQQLQKVVTTPEQEQKEQAYAG